MKKYSGGYSLIQSVMDLNKQAWKDIKYMENILGGEVEHWTLLPRQSQINNIKKAFNSTSNSIQQTNNSIIYNIDPETFKIHTGNGEGENGAEKIVGSTFHMKLPAQFNRDRYKVAKFLSENIYSQEKTFDVAMRKKEKPYNIPIGNTTKNYTLLNPYYGDSCKTYRKCLKNDVPLFLILEDNIGNVKNMTIVIRGTSTVTDILEDMNASSIKVDDWANNLRNTNLDSEGKQGMVAILAEESSYFGSIPFNEHFTTELSQCLVHKQFLISALEIYAIIFKFFNDNQKSFFDYENINICGHSMGGAVSTILSLLLYTILFNKSIVNGRKIPNINVDTFNPGSSFVENVDNSSYPIENLKRQIKNSKKEEKCNYSICNYIYRQDPVSRANLFRTFALAAFCLKKYDDSINFFNEYKSSLNTLNNINGQHFAQMKTVIFYVNDETDLNWNKKNDIYNFVDTNSERCFTGYNGFNSIFFSPLSVNDHSMENFPNIQQGGKGKYKRKRSKKSRKKKKQNKKSHKKNKNIKK